MRKLCLICRVNPVEGLMGYDEDANNCAPCRSKVFKDTPVAGQWSRQRDVELRHYEKDVLQPRNKDGTFNKKFVRAYGTKKLEKEYKTNAREIEKVTY